MKRSLYSILLSALVAYLLPFCLYAQMKNLHGEFKEHRDGVHSGNMVRTSFYNDGFVGRVTQDPDDIGGEWPINSGHTYVGDACVLVGAEVVDRDGNLVHIVSTPIGPHLNEPGGARHGQLSPEGDWYTFLPLPGFASPDTNKVAMSHWRWSWPSFWPDKMDDKIDTGWPGSWDGYFGKNKFNADQESYFVMDDYNNREYAFYPDTTDTLRRGLGMRVTARGFQWSNALVEDDIFWLYDITNVGTTTYDKMLFGMMIGNMMGNTMSISGDYNDDCGAYDLEEDLAYSWDNDDIGAGNWTPVGYLGYAFLESPGNPYDGIDNDDDGASGSGPTITEEMFEPRIIQTGDDIVLIDYTTYKRTVTQMPNDTLYIYYRDKVIKIWPGKTLVEIERNNIDDNLNGLIDENNGATIGDPPNQVTNYLYVGHKYVDYLSGGGSDNLLIDERRDDGIDNDGDWDPITDDVGLDGVDGTGDPGEGDGIPTSGAGTNLPGEPHIDKTDIDESDMIGLTSFFLFQPYDYVPLYDDERIWHFNRPGYLNSVLQDKDTDFMFGSGYFPMKPGQTERFSIAMIFGENKDDLLRNTFWAKKAYTENYNFARAPRVPILTAVPGDHRVTLYWDDLAEKSLDPISGYDFEGYRIYRSTDPSFGDMTTITDAHGSPTFLKPLAQFDLKNEYKGYAAVPIKGVHYWLGENTGIQHSWVDTTAINGFKYYYAVTSYDHGDPEKGIPPSECSKYISISTSGEVDKGKNVAIVRPEAPSAGYVSSSLDSIKLIKGSTTGIVHYTVIDPQKVLDNHTYHITFEDTLIKNKTGPDTLTTKNFTLTDITNPDYVDTLILKSTLLQPEDELPVTDGFRLSFQNEKLVALNHKLSGWNRQGIFNFDFKSFSYHFLTGLPKPADYRIQFGEVGIDTSTFLELSSRIKLPAKPVNFRVTNTTEGKDIDFAFWELDGGNGVFSALTQENETDIIIFLERDAHDSLVVTWSFSLDIVNYDTTDAIPQPGDVVEIRLRKPFLSPDVFEFTTHAARVDKELAKDQMDRIKVVPNPYVVANSWEPLNPYASGRGPRELHFTHLPPRCTIKIFNIRGQLVDTIEHNLPLWDGTEIWNMRSKDNLDIAYGVYIYYVEAKGIGKKIGKFAIIK